MSSSTTVINHARKMQQVDSTTEKLDLLAQAIEALATYLGNIETKIDQIRR